MLIKHFPHHKCGDAMAIPNALASSLLEIAQPSLFDKTITGLPSSRGLKTLSQEQ